VGRQSWLVFLIASAAVFAAARINGGTLYGVRGVELIAVDTATGKSETVFKIVPARLRSQRPPLGMRVKAIDIENQILFLETYGLDLRPGSMWLFTYDLRRHLFRPTAFHASKTADYFYDPVMRSLYMFVADGGQILRVDWQSGSTELVVNLPCSSMVFGTFDPIAGLAYVRLPELLCGIGGPTGEFLNEQLFIVNIRASQVTPTAFRTNLVLEYVADSTTRSLLAVVTKSFLSPQDELLKVDSSNGLTHSVGVLPQSLRVADFDRTGRRLYLRTWINSTTVYELDLGSFDLRPIGFATNYDIASWAYSP
jgi:hypothetical protein